MSRPSSVKSAPPGVNEAARIDLSALERAIPPGDRLLLDTSALAAYLDAGEATHGLAALILDDFVGSGRNEAIVSMVTVMEILVRPLRASPPGHHTVLAFLRNQPNLTAVPLDLQMAQDAAFLRAAHRFPPPDALIIATGLATQVGHLVTNDGDWPTRLQPLDERIRVALLSRFMA